MRRVEWDYQVKAVIEMNRTEVEALWGMAKDHYDYTVKSMAKAREPFDPDGRAGLLYGWLNRFDGTTSEETIQITVASREVNLICKALEPLGMAGGDMCAAERHPEAVKLWMPFRQLMTEMNAEYCRLCDDPIAGPQDSD